MLIIRVRFRLRIGLYIGKSYRVSGWIQMSKWVIGYGNEFGSRLKGMGTE